MKLGLKRYDRLKIKKKKSREDYNKQIGVFSGVILADTVQKLEGKTTTRKTIASS